MAFNVSIDRVFATLKKSAQKSNQLKQETKLFAHKNTKSIKIFPV